MDRSFYLQSLFGIDEKTASLMPIKPAPLPPFLHALLMSSTALFQGNGIE
jgi:hypothetical protein